VPNLHFSTTAPPNNPSGAAEDDAAIPWRSSLSSGGEAFAWSPAERRDWSGGGAPASSSLTGTGAQGRRPPLFHATMGLLGQFPSIQALFFECSWVRIRSEKRGKKCIGSHLPQARVLILPGRLARTSEARLWPSP
jgi:hypothetical protein